ncbi:helix-turn-helix domain-containing protein [Flavitalea flava]
MIASISAKEKKSNYNVLLVDHNKPELDKLHEYLADMCDLFTARTETAITKMMETHPIHLIIISIELNYADGAEVCTRLKSSLHYSHIPVILLIPSDKNANRIKSLQSGADAHIERPFSREYLLAQIKNTLSNRSRIKDYFAHSLFAHMSTVSSSKENEEFLNKLNDFISANLPNIELNVDLLARLMNMSRPTLYRKIKCISDLTPNELINVARMNRAAELISDANYKIFEIAKMVGFNSRSNFGKAFLKQFNLTPTEYQRMKKRYTSLRRTPFLPPRTN